MSEAILESPPLATDPIPVTAIEKIAALVKKHCSPERQELLQPILDQLELHKETPASTLLSKHGGFKGGLLIHTHNVMQLAMSFKLGILQMASSQMLPCVLEETGCLTNQAVVTSVLLHDINKTEDLIGNLHYVPNILTKGERSEKKPWKINENYDHMKAVISELTTDDQHLIVLLSHPSLQCPSGLFSLALAEKWSPGLTATLNEAEKQAIVWHGGRYEKGNMKGFANSETLLWLVTHAADMASSIVGL